MLLLTSVSYKQVAIGVGDDCGSCGILAPTFIEDWGGGSKGRKVAKVMRKACHGWIRTECGDVCNFLRFFLEKEKQLC